MWTAGTVYGWIPAVYACQGHTISPAGMRAAPEYIALYGAYLLALYACFILYKVQGTLVNVKTYWGQGGTG